MRIKEGFKVVKLSGVNTVVSQPGKKEVLNNTIVLTESSMFLWNMLQKKDTSKSEMLKELLNEFDISTVLALGDIDVFIRTMRENGIIEE